MILTHFKEILNNFIFYLYPTFEITEEVEFYDQQYASLNDDGTLNIKGDIHGIKGYKIKRERPFLPEDCTLLTSFISEVNLIESYPNLSEEYVETLIQSALNKAIATTLSTVSTSTITMVINSLSKFSERTYEGRNISFGVVINDKISCKNRVDNVYFTNFISSPFAAVLTNGTESFIEVDSDGYVNRYVQLNSEKSDLALAPYNYTRILEYSGEDVTAIVLTAKGEILIYHDSELRYTKRGGRWNPYSHKETIKLIHERSKNDNLLFAKAVYLTAIDVSFTQTGGIISFLDENEVQNALNHINIKDICNEKYFEIKRKLMAESNDPEYESIKNITFEEFLKLKQNIKSCLLNRLIDGRKFFMLYRKLRQELVGIDGATIIDYNGDIVAIGAIVKIEAGSTGGGRVAAARTLSHYGISIEISSDSSIKGFALDENDEPEAIFTISDFQ
ncbi:hypothetical protein IKQ02_00075 [bacterium]|nr:hypothetical protein [bacterium]